MKCIVIFLAVCLACVYGSLISNDNQSDEDFCAKESGIGREKLEQLKLGRSVVIDRKVGCHVACIMKRNGMMSKDGDINKQAEKIPKSDSFQKCLTLTGVDACDTAARVVECALKDELERKKAAEIEE